MTFLSEKIEFRLRPIELAAIQTIIEKKPDLFENLSHFCRCAVIRFAREYKEEDIIRENEPKSGEIRELE